MRMVPNSGTFLRVLSPVLIMGEVINLRKARKQAKKREDAERAASNRAVHGQTKAEKTFEARRAEQIRRHLDAHRIDSGDA
jgi:hypothetical protein